MNGCIRYRRSICPNPKRNATICDPNLRTMNTNAECGSDEDLYYYFPWRSPGVAPVIDACGAAGGRLAGQGPGSAGADYQATPFAKRGDVGSKLPRRPSGTVWTAGDVVEVSWTQKAFHGGGCVLFLFVCRLGNVIPCALIRIPVPMHLLVVYRLSTDRHPSFRLYHTLDFCAGTNTACARRTPTSPRSAFSRTQCPLWDSPLSAGAVLAESRFFSTYTLPSPPRAAFKKCIVSRV